MGGGAEVARTGVGRQEPREGRRGPPSAGALLQAVSDRPGTEDLAGHGVGESRVEVGGAVLLQALEQGDRVAGDEVPAAGEGLEEGVGVRAGLAEAIAAAELMGPALGRGE